MEEVKITEPQPVKVEAPKNKLRFKTLKEIQEMGNIKDWRDHFGGYWTKGMDSLVGQRYEFKPAPSSCGRILGRIGVFTITYSMVKAITEEEFNAMPPYVPPRLHIETRKDYGGTTIVTMSGLRGIFHMNLNPTGNCQVASIAYLCQLFDTLKPDEVIPEIKEALKQTSCGKTLIMFDVKDTYERNLNELPGVLFKNPYDSTNGSRMIAGMLKL